MCDFGVISGPTIAVMATSMMATMASAALSIKGQMDQRSAAQQYQQNQVDANEKQMAQNRELATRAYLDQAVAANQNLAQTREATAASNFDQQVKGAEARGSVMAAAAEGGVTGLSLQALLADFHKQEDMFLTRNEQNLLFKQQQTANETAGLRTQADSRISQIKPYIPGPIAPVDYFGPALGIVNSGAGLYLGAKAATAKGTGTTINNYYN